MGDTSTTTSAAITIRSERPGDEALISDIVRRAYADVPYSDHREHLMVERLRETDAYVSALSLLATIDTEAAGHILLTRAHIRNEYSALPVLALAPLSVVPEFRSRGVGRRLVRNAHERATELGFAAIILVGIPGYYPQFGYERLSRHPITLPFAAPDANSLILALRPGALDGVSGRVDYAEAWLNH
jgi:predicted N-acetyltransferase YhbS